MEWVALIAGLAAVLIALGSLVLAIRAGPRGGRAEQLASRGEQREEGREQRETEQAVEQRRGDPIVSPKGGSGGSTANPVTHYFLVRTGSQGTISEWYLWIEDGGGNRTGGLIPLVPGRTSRKHWRGSPPAAPGRADAFRVRVMRLGAASPDGRSDTRRQRATELTASASDADARNAFTVSS
jgi:hypothetical protein